MPITLNSYFLLRYSIYSMVQNNQLLKRISASKKLQIAKEDVAKRFEEKMESIGVKQKEREARIKADLSGAQYIDLKGFPISPETLALFSEKQAQELKAVCFFRGSNDIRIGAVDPKNPRLLQLIVKLAHDHHADVKVYLISEKSFGSAFKLYQMLPKVRKFISGFEITEDDIKRYEKEIRTFKDLNAKLREVSITDMLTLIIAAALKARSSDIHIEAEESSVKVRFRVDGLLHEVASLESKVWPQVVSRVKLAAKLKINIEDRPQDGRFTIFLDKEKIDVRVSTLPTAYGESVVLRILMATTTGLAFEDLGLRGKAFEELKNEIKKPNGMIVTTGPTGSGKTTTLYAILNRLNKPGTKIITIEDPIEYKLSGVNQSQVNREKNYTFANGLRSILRQDPDIVMVGEIRDLETAEIAINAALTGHLVASTLHTNDAAGTIPRLLSMEVKAFLLAPAINAMIGQRLVRKICDFCKQKAELDSRVMSKVMDILSEIAEESGFRIPDKDLKKLQFSKGGGCEKCQGLGYKGRTGVFEVMTMNKEVENLILTGHVSEYDMRSIAIKYGMITMIQDGLLKAVDGITTVEEVFRVAKDTSSRL